MLEINIKSLAEAENIALKLSLKNWNTYYHCFITGVNTYAVGRYYEGGATCYYISGKRTPHKGYK